MTIGVAGFKFEKIRVELVNISRSYLLYVAVRLSELTRVYARAVCRELDENGLNEFQMNWIRQFIRN